MTEIYGSVVGISNYKGSQVFKIGSYIRLVKEPDNDYDAEAIVCELKYIGKAGYLANSTKTVIKGTMSAGRIYDKIGDVCFAEIKFVANDSVIAKILNPEEIEELQKQNADDDFYFSEN